jgi:transposase-like protein
MSSAKSRRRWTTQEKLAIVSEASERESHWGLSVS